MSRELAESVAVGQAWREKGTDQIGHVVGFDGDKVIVKKSRTTKIHRDNLINRYVHEAGQDQI